MNRFEGGDVVLIRIIVLAVPIGAVAATVALCVAFTRLAVRCHSRRIVLTQFRRYGDAFLGALSLLTLEVVVDLTFRFALTLCLILVSAPVCYMVTVFRYIYLRPTRFALKLETGVREGRSNIYTLTTDVRTKPGPWPKWRAYINDAGELVDDELNEDA